MPNKPKKPNYDPIAIMKELIDSIVLVYSDSVSTASPPSLRQIADEFDLNPLKVRKLLITAGVYQSDIADYVMRLYHEKKRVAEIMTLTGLSKASVNSYLPYTKIPYKMEEISVTAERCRKFRERRTAVERMKQSVDNSVLWDTLLLFQSYPFYTTKGLKFTYTIKGGEMFVSRKDKSITRATVDLAFQKALSLEGIISGPKKLGGVGASYLYPVFIRIGVIKPSADEQKRADTDS
ncbi:MAG: hypothetical protein LUC60_05635 [Lachnospiraceae bacterium]|nr:hypothetical protein [Lachnospiraceae bacterium]